MCLHLKGPALTSQGDKPWGEAKGEAWDHQKPGLFKVKPNWNSRNISLNGSPLLHGGWISGWPAHHTKDGWTCGTATPLATNTMRVNMAHNANAPIQKREKGSQSTHTFSDKLTLQMINIHLGWCRWTLIMVLNRVITSLGHNFLLYWITGYY